MSTQDTFISHLVELRQRLMRALAAVLVLFIALFIWPGSGPIYDLLAQPEIGRASCRERVYDDV